MGLKMYMVFRTVTNLKFGKYRVIVAGNEGLETVVYYNRSIDDNSEQIVRIPCTDRLFYFDYNGYIFEITMRSETQNADNDNAVYDRILETFQILE